MVEHPSTEELALVKDYILLPMLLTMIASNNDQMAQSDHTLRQVFVLVAERLADLVKVRQWLRKADIKVYEDKEGTTHNELRHIYYCRNYRYEIGLQRFLIRAEINERLKKCTAQLLLQHR